MSGKKKTTKKKNTPPKRSSFYPKEVKVQAEEMYMTYTPMSEIAEKLKVNPKTVATWRDRGNWFSNRRHEEMGAVKEIAERKKHKLAVITDMCLEAIQIGVQKDIRRGISGKEIAKYADIVGNLEKLYRLSTGQATEVSEHRSISASIDLTDPKNVTNALRGDPFLQLEDEEATVVESEADTIISDDT